MRSKRWMRVSWLARTSLPLALRIGILRKNHKGLGEKHTPRREEHDPDKFLLLRVR
jgi:hypothetical protein